MRIFIEEGECALECESMIKLMVESPAVDRYDHRSLRALNYGGAPMLVEDLKQAMAKLGPCLVQLFGQAESPMTIYAIRR